MDDFLDGLQDMTLHNPNSDFVPGTCFTEECAEALDLNPAKWLWLEELKLI
ncbi:hypothetical protein PAXRUDRAFT_19456 [Paxillus rubicundulus Ve08.2h10]|uniref:Uncharacterized protein n=1 Tax=Paxillus rubicundulus Ve08.2h10 TaxID=930991 RepID=A0A0D0DC79_9AGAM|nr:hypothetical protein PAXRUDRAFT_19456 [Paxillus rubicundulus Ve08.2h10]